MRACAVKVNEVVGVAGFVVPGMRVDVLITRSLPLPVATRCDGARVRTLLQNIQVLSAGTNFQKDQEGKPEQAQVVNLLVTPVQAEILRVSPAMRREFSWCFAIRWILRYRKRPEPR